MMSWRYLVIGGLLFVGEHLVTILIWPFFVIFTLLRSKKLDRDFTRLALITPFFDLFSGFKLGWLTATVLIVALSIYFVRRSITLVGNPWPITFLTWLMFAAELAVVLTVKVNSNFLFHRLPFILIQALITFLVFALISIFLKSSQRGRL